MPDILDRDVYPDDTLWVAMIVKYDIDTSEGKVDYLATTEASTQALATRNISNMQWGDTYWVEGKSKTVILTIFRADNKKIFATPVKRIRRKRRNFEV